MLVSLWVGGATAHADDELDGLGTWTGSGLAFDAKGKSLGPFTVAVTRRSVGPKQVETRGTVTLAGGKTIPVEQRTTSGDGAGYRIEGKDGNGGGLCFGEGLCQSYQDIGSGKGRATTVVVDAPDRIRILVTELDQGRAVAFYRQTLVRKQ